MARRNSGGRSRSSGFSKPRPAARSSPMPATAASRLPAPAPQSASAPAPSPIRSEASGIGSVIAEGMAFGGGSAIANRAVDFFMGPRVVRHETVASAPAAQPTPPVNKTRLSKIA